jgi:hypothetical protein
LPVLSDRWLSAVAPRIYNCLGEREREGEER